MKKREIQLVNGTRPSLVTRYFVVKVRRTRQGLVRVAFAFSRKAGNAVLRNRLKRRIRDMLRRVSSGTKGVDLFFIARRPLSQVTDVSWQRERTRIREWFEDYQSTGHLSA